MEENENKEPVETYATEEEEKDLNFRNIKEILKPYYQPKVLIFFLCILLLVIAAFYLGYMRGYENCLVGCNERIANMSIIII